MMMEMDKSKTKQQQQQKQKQKSLLSQQLSRYSAQSTISSSSLSSTTTTTPTPVVPRAQTTTSRYRDEYGQVARLGSGGYARVYHVQSRVDGQEYAVKRIPLAADSQDSPLYLQEVRVLAQLHNEHIVRYHSSWVERHAAQSLSSVVSHDDTADCRAQTDDDDDFDDDDCANEQEQEDSGTDIQFVAQQQKHHQSAPIQIKQQQQQAGGRTQSAQSHCPVKHRGGGAKRLSVAARRAQLVDNPLYSKALQQVTGSISVKQHTDTLYLQMELCRGGTLRQWLDRRNQQVVLATCGVGGGGHSVDHQQAWRLLRQLLVAVEHVHQNGFVHNDVTPANVMLRDDASGSEPHLLLGDFGLARAIGEPLSVGVQQTGTYSPPTTPTNADTATDMYALGMIAVELHVAFETRMERAVTLSQVRQGTWRHQNAQLESLVHRMTQQGTTAALVLQEIDDILTPATLQPQLQEQQHQQFHMDLMHQQLQHEVDTLRQQLLLRGRDSTKRGSSSSFTLIISSSSMVGPGGGSDGLHHY